MEKTMKDTDALVLLGDQAYNFDKKQGKVGNDFMNFIKPITSSLPYQVFIKNKNNFFIKKDMCRKSRIKKLFRRL